MLLSGVVSKDDRVLVICGGPRDRDALRSAGFTDVTISNLDDGMSSGLAPYAWAREDAEALSFEDDSFDVVVANAGLHHCYSPHRALLEMYRVARASVIAFEARDSFAMRAVIRLGFGVDYELEAVSDEGFRTGGAGNGPIPNFIYRWTEREVVKTIASFDPMHVPQIRFFYGLRLPYERFEKTRRPIQRFVLSIVGPAIELIARAFPTQGNQFAFVITKNGALHPWLSLQDGQVKTDPAVVERMGRAYRDEGDADPGPDFRER